MSLNLKAFIAEQLEVNENEVKLESTFDDLGADSLDSVEFVMALEEKCDLQIDDDVSEKFTDVQSILDYLVSQKVDVVFDEVSFA